jgi:hypothetical protein
MLTFDAGPEHVGTTDVDLAVEIGLVSDDLGFGWLEAALAASSFEVDSDDRSGWRWRSMVSGVRVKLDLVCERQYQQTGLPIRLDGCVRTSAMNLYGPGAAGYETQIVDLEGDVDGAVVHTDVRVVGLGGYVLTKAAAALSRGLDRDYYAAVLAQDAVGAAMEFSDALESLRSRG